MGDWARRAQSSGEWPGCRLTWREGFLGIDVAVGGGMRPDELEGAPRRGMGRLREVGVGEVRRGIPLRVGMRFPVVGAGGGGVALDDGGGGLAMRDVVGEMLRGCAVGGEGRREGVGDERPTVVSEGMRRTGEEADAGRGMPDVRGLGSLELGTGGGGIRSEADLLGGGIGAVLICGGDGLGGVLCSGATRLNCGGCTRGGDASMPRANSDPLLSAAGGSMAKDGIGWSGTISIARSAAGPEVVAGSMLNVGGGVIVKDGGEDGGCCCSGACSSEDSGAVDSSGRTRLGIGSSLAIAVAFGVVCSSSSSSDISSISAVLSWSRESSVSWAWLSTSSVPAGASVTSISTSGSCIIIDGDFDRPVTPFSSASGKTAFFAFDGTSSLSSSSGCSIGGREVGPLTLRWDRFANKLGSQAGGRKQKRTTDATRSEIPMIAMARRSRQRDGWLRGMCVAVDSVADNLDYLG